MAEPVNDVMAEKIYIKIAMVFFTLVGLAGGSMSIAGPVVGLTLNPNELTAANFQQVERFGLDAALYFDCDKVDTAFGQNMVAQMVATMSDPNNTISNDSDSRTTTTDTFERLCNDRKASHLYIAITSGVFTMVGMFVFIACAVVKKFEPDFVYIVPLLLSFLMIYDFVETNSNMFAYIKRCTEVATYEDSKSMKLKNIVVWAPMLSTDNATQTFGRYGVTRYGHACRFDDETVHDSDEAEVAWLAAYRAANNNADPELPVFYKDGPCRPDLADDLILCTYFYSCQNSNNGVACKDIDIKDGGEGWPDGDDDQEDRACNDLGEGLLVWILGACFNVVANGMMLSALAIRRNTAQYSDVSDKEMQERVRQERVMAGAA